MRKNVFHSLHQGRRGWQVYIATIGLASLLFAPTGTIAIGQSDDELTDSQIKQILIRQSIASYSGRVVHARTAWTAGVVVAVDVAPIVALVVPHRSATRLT